ncbi:FAD-dependent oxidoreductase [Pararcticibacter amylolyticus]|uniref:FAD-binding dehydrogenase n=1 Tax=Pararcticibacter amylolyticus TaxID=2173175 RepID=A0A2U2PF12_9SPHI|nr:FAD-dependent oxidoreductase [Pararcticibacter amylolyticus]PWG79914.1 FAD-binding dehydrogenase [Pararcticibacter amylolyticus]
MIKQDGEHSRKLHLQELRADLIVAGGGLAGVCAAVTAARTGTKVILVQDRPVLGGNSSSEVRLWVLGATSHMGNNNRWAREGGVIDEILVENTYKNPEGNPLILDMLLLDKVKQEANITLLLNTAVYSLDKKDAETIDCLRAFCSQNSTEYILKAPLFCDASGDGIVGFLSGAAFRMGAESRQEFDEPMAPTTEYGELLGHSLYFYSKDTGKPVKFTAPDFALPDISVIPRYRSFNAQDYGCRLWWVEYGGRLDTVHQTEDIKWQLWKVVYGVWNYIKNSGKFPEAETLTLEWVGTIPGKRESRRFEGDYIMTQHDLVEQREHDDAVAYGGWSIDLHPADGVFSERPGCNQWHSKGVFQIPYRSMYSRNISNLFLAGRIISVSHVAFGATRVMATVAHAAQAVGIAANLCTKYGVTPAQIIEKGYLSELQQNLIASGQYIPGLRLKDHKDLVHSASITASSQLSFSGFSQPDLWKPLTMAAGQLIPLEKGPVPVFSIPCRAVSKELLTCELWLSSRKASFTPDVLLASRQLQIEGEGYAELDFNVSLEESGYVFLIFRQNENLELGYSNQRITGILSVFNLINKAVSNYGKQSPPPGSGVDEFEFWCPQRRPQGENLAFRLSRHADVFSPENVRNGVDRPVDQPNAWVAGSRDPAPCLSVSWEEPQRISTIVLSFDSDFDHPMESVLMTHPETVMPFCVRNYRICDDQGNELYSRSGNYQTRNIIRLDDAVSTKGLKIYVEHPLATVPAALFGLRCYEN